MKHVEQIAADFSKVVIYVAPIGGRGPGHPLGPGAKL